LKVLIGPGIFSHSPCPTDNRFTVIQVTIHINSNGVQSAHANSVFVDHQLQEYERFEPMPLGGEFDKAVDAALSDPALKEHYNIHRYKYIAPMDYCPKPTAYKKNPNIRHARPGELSIFGPQMIVSDMVPKNQKVWGTCIFWSMFYIEQRLRHPEATRHDIIKSFTSKTPAELAALIHKYAIEVHEAGFPVNENVYHDAKKLLDPNYIKT
jgi:hypothetical protein